MNQKRNKGFTIVELLIVIVIIGILAVIALNAFTRSQKEARAATVKSDLKTAAKQLELAKTDAGTYPSSASTLPKSPGTSYEYTYNSTNDTYCLTATNGDTSYKVANGTSNPSSGGCAGHGVNGVAAITNVMINPSAEGSISLIEGYYGGPMAIDTSRKVHGNNSLRTTTNSGTNPQGAIWNARPVTSNATYTCSISLSGTPGAVVYVAGRATSPVGNYIGEGYGQQTVTLADAWQRVAITFNAPNNTGTLSLQYRLATPTSGVTIWADAAMCTEGANQYTYADGSSASWIWNGTANESTSTGPAP